MNNTARVFKVENALAKVVRLPGGRTVAEALRAADAKIGRLKESTVSAMQQRIAHLAVLAEVGKAGNVCVLDEVYAVGNEVLGLAGSFGMHELGEAAYSLCDLVDAFRDGAPTNWTAIDVHVHGLRVLCLDDSDADGRKSILAGLHKVRDRFVAGAAPAKG